MCELCLTKLVGSFEIQIRQYLTLFIYVQAFLVLIVSKWLARFSTICMKDGLLFFFFNFQ